MEVYELWPFMTKTAFLEALQSDSFQGRGWSGRGRTRRGRDVVSQSVGATTGINLDCDRSSAACSPAMHQQSPRKSTPDLSQAGGKAFLSPIVVDSHRNQ